MLYQIGDKVFYFDDSLKGELTIKESVVYGSFVSRATGDIYYYLKEKQVPAFCVSDTEEGAKELLTRFDAYRTDYVARVEAQTARFNEFKANYMAPELADKNPETEE